MWGRGGIGIRSGLKIRRRKACGFESHRPYQVGKWNDRRIDLGPSGGARTDEVDFRRENCPVGSFQEIARGLQPEGSGPPQAARESHRPYQVGKWNDRRIDLGPSGGARTDEVDFRRENCPVGSFQEIARGLQPEGSGPPQAARESHRPYQVGSHISIEAEVESPRHDGS